MQDLKTKDIVYLPGVGPARSKLLKEQLNIHTWHDLLYYFPYKHIDRTRLYRINELTSDMPFVQVKGRFLSFEEMGAGRKKRLVGHFTDGQSLMDLVWFNATKYITKTIKLNRDYIIFGRPSFYRGEISMVHPELDLVEKVASRKYNSGMQGIYPSTEKIGSALGAKGFYKIICNAWSVAEEYINEYMPQWLRTAYDLMPLREAVYNIHFPQSAEKLHAAERRLKFDEVLGVQLAIQSRRTERMTRKDGFTFPKVGELFNSFFNERLPFSLTSAQKRVIKE